MSSRSISEASLGADGQRLVSALNGYFSDLHGRNLLDAHFWATRELRSSPIGSDRWIDAATGLLNAAMHKARDGTGTGAVLTPDFFSENFPDRWKAGKPIEVADVSELVSPEKTLEKDFDATENGTPFCPR